MSLITINHGQLSSCQQGTGSSFFFLFYVIKVTKKVGFIVLTNEIKVRNSCHPTSECLIRSRHDQPIGRTGSIWSPVWLISEPKQLIKFVLICSELNYSDYNPLPLGSRQQLEKTSQSSALVIQYFISVDFLWNARHILLAWEHLQSAYKLKERRLRSKQYSVMLWISPPQLFFEEMYF